MENRTSGTSAATDGKFVAEEIFQEMLRETFDAPQTGTSRKQSPQTLPESHTNISPFAKKLADVLTLQLQTVLSGMLQITASPQQCLSYAKLYRLFPGRSYFSLFGVEHPLTPDIPGSVWVLCLERSVGEGLAFASHHRNVRKHRNIFRHLREADSMVYLEIGDFLRKIFEHLLQVWPQSEEWEIVRCRHILQLNFIQEVAREEQCVVQPFFLENKECSGAFHLIFPRRYP